MRRPTRNRLKEYAIAGVLTLALVWLLVMNWGIYQKEEIARHAARDTKVELQSLQGREAALQKSIQDLNTPRGQEATVRATFGVAKPGEEVIIVVPQAASSTPPKLNWWQSVLDWFGI